MTCKLMIPKVESTTTSWKSRPNNLIVFQWNSNLHLLQITVFDYFSTPIIKLRAIKRSFGLNCHLKLRLCSPAHIFFQKFQVHSISFLEFYLTFASKCFSKLWKNKNEKKTSSFRERAPTTAHNLNNRVFLSRNYLNNSVSVEKLSATSITKLVD